MANTEFTDQQLIETYPDGIQDYFWSHARNQLILRSIRKAGIDVQRDRILEIGCGRGVVVRYLRSMGVDCQGVELSPTPVDRDLRDWVTAGKDFSDLDLAFRHGIDCILLLDVIEHIPDAGNFLRRIGEAFPNITNVIITVPARAELWSYYDTYYGHFRRYDIELIKNDVMNGHLKIKYTSYWFHTLYPIMWMLAKMFGSRPIVQKTPKYIMLHRILSKILFLESIVFPKNMPGTSILCIARKT